MKTQDQYFKRWVEDGDLIPEGGQRTTDIKID